MNELFFQYKDACQIPEALLVGRNLLNRAPGSAEAFAPYFDLLCSLADGTLLSSLEGRQNYANQASVALSFYEENADLSTDMIQQITSCQERLNTILEKLQNEQETNLQIQRNKTEQQNSDCIKELYRLKDSIRKAESQEMFDDALLKINAIDQKIDQSALTQEQKQRYAQLTKEHTELINEKMLELEYRKNVDYNKEAVEAYSKAFKAFKDSENRYKDFTQLRGLSSGTLFAFDASRLFNETLIYYNHVYSYIFSKLDDDGKFALTKFSIESERKLR